MNRRDLRRPCSPIPCNSLLLARRAEQCRHGQVVRAPGESDLSPGAVLRILVRPPAEEARAVPEAVLLKLVVAHLADELRLDRVPVELFAARPAALPAGDAITADRSRRAQLRQLFLELAANRRREAGTVADEVEPTLRVVEAEEERRDPAFGLVAPAEADDQAVCGAVRLHLDDSLARAGEVRDAEPLRDDAVEAGGLELLQPLAGLGRIASHRREPELLADALELGTPLLERQLVDRLALPAQDVERDELGRDLGRELADPALSGMQTELHRIEVEDAVALDHYLAVQRRIGGQQLADLAELREVAKKRPRVPAPDGELALQVLHHPAKPVPLRLVLPVAFRELRDELGLHRREGKSARRH